jgi:hypothetical protein
VLVMIKELLLLLLLLLAEGSHTGSTSPTNSAD